MKNIYLSIKQLKDKMNQLIDGNIDNLQNPEVIKLSQTLDKLIYMSMQEEKARQESIN